MKNDDILDDTIIDEEDEEMADDADISGMRSFPISDVQNGLKRKTNELYGKISDGDAGAKEPLRLIEKIDRRITWYKNQGAEHLTLPEKYEYRDLRNALKAANVPEDPNSGERVRTEGLKEFRAENASGPKHVDEPASKANYFRAQLDAEARRAQAMLEEQIEHERTGGNDTPPGPGGGRK